MSNPTVPNPSSRAFLVPPPAQVVQPLKRRKYSTREKDFIKALGVEVVDPAPTTPTPTPSLESPTATVERVFASRVVCKARAPVVDSARVKRCANIIRSSQSPNNVRLVFPGRNGEPDLELWCNKTILSSVSPYYALQLSSDFIEGTASSSKRRKAERTKREPVEKDFEDTDDESDAIVRKELKSAFLDNSEGPKFHEVIITQAAYTTYSCLLDWILTGHISLKKSSKDISLTSCSPKCLYRLAHLLEIPQLIKYSFDTIVERMNVKNVASLLFSDFAITYEEVQKEALKFVSTRWKEVKETKAMKKAQELALGERAEDFGPVALRLLMAVQ